MKRVLVTGGGSGGHVTPAIAIGQQLQARGIDVLFVGSNSGLEEALVTPAGLPYRGISSGKLRRYFSWANLSDAFRVVLGLLQALVLMGRERPDAVFSKGGFVSFPLVVAAWVWRIPVVAHESDATQGLANRLSAPFVRTLCSGFPNTTAGSFKGRFVYTGAPVRPELLRGDSARGRELVGASAEQKVLLVTGGSLGADALNAAVIDASSELAAAGWFVLHVAGPGKDHLPAGPAYRSYDYVADGWADMLAAADLVVTRAGANTLFELLALGKINLLVPLPLAGSRGDQIDNARYAQTAGYSRVLAQEALSAQSLLAEIDQLWHSREEALVQLASFTAPDAIGAIIDELIRVAPVLAEPSVRDTHS